MNRLRIGTRGSALALAQTQLVQSALREKSSDLEIEIVVIETTGDKKQGTPAARVNDKKEWVQELELALLNNTIDIAIHSGKDVPNLIEPDTTLLPILEREIPQDVFIGQRKTDATGDRTKFADLQPGDILGTASLRRRAALLSYRPELHVAEHRGNVPTRIRKLDENPALKGIILAAAGVRRLIIPDVTFEILPTDVFVPAMNQGILVAQHRSQDGDAKNLLRQLATPRTTAAFAAERACTEVLEGDCHSAMGVYAEPSGSHLKVVGAVWSHDGSTRITAQSLGKLEEASSLGEKVGRDLLQKGAVSLLRGT